MGRPFTTSEAHRRQIGVPNAIGNFLFYALRTENLIARLNPNRSLEKNLSFSNDRFGLKRERLTRCQKQQEQGMAFTEYPYFQN